MHGEFRIVLIGSCKLTYVALMRGNTSVNSNLGMRMERSGVHAGSAKLLRVSPRITNPIRSDIRARSEDVHSGSTCTPHTSVIKSSRAVVKEDALPVVGEVRPALVDIDCTNSDSKWCTSGGDGVSVSALVAGCYDHRDTRIHSLAFHPFQLVGRRMGECGEDSHW